MRPELEKRIARIAGDRESGASQLLTEAIGILRDALGSGEEVVNVAQALCRAQPSMAPMWNAAIAALGAREQPERFERFAARVARAPDAIARFGLALFTDGATAPLRLVTISFSATVLHLVRALVRVRPVQVACSEGRPALEGRALAAQLAAAQAAVTFFSDAAIGHAIAGADAVLIGADAVTPEFVLNKSGTRMLAAAAAPEGVPVYVAAGRDKFVGSRLARHLSLREADAGELWAAPPAGVDVRNPYFERTPLDLVAALITDGGVIGAADVPAVCDAQSTLAWDELDD